MAGRLLLDATDPWIRWDWFWRHVRDFEARLGEHVQLTLIAFLVGLAIAAPTAVTATALIGQGVLRQLINEGLIQDFKTPLLVGTVLSIALALVADVSLAGAERLLTPWSRARAA